MALAKSVRQKRAQARYDGPSPTVAGAGGGPHQLWLPARLGHARLLTLGLATVEQNPPIPGHTTPNYDSLMHACSQRTSLSLTARGDAI